VKGMVVTRHMDCATVEGERRWMKQNHHDECCHLYRKKLLVTIIFMQLHIGFVCVHHFARLNACAVLSVFMTLKSVFMILTTQKVYREEICCKDINWFRIGFNFEVL
jgi:hypothetical protein